MLIADSRKKSDRRDARTLAEALKGGLADNCSVAVPSERARRTRCLMRTRHLVVKQATSTMKAARSLLDSVGVSVSKGEWAKEEQWEAVLAEQNDEWAIARRFMSIEALEQAQAGQIEAKENKSIKQIAA